jgi:flagellar hook assembly protein FlgD
MPEFGLDKSLQQASYNKASATQVDKAKGGQEKKFNSKHMAAISEMTERKTPDQYIKNDPEASRKQLEKNKDFLIKMILASAKNIDPLAEDGGKTAEMTQTMTTIANIDAMMSQSAKMDEIVNAVKNPGFSPTELQGKEVEYDDSQRYFEKKRGNVDFSYNLEFNDKSEDISGVKTTIEIVNFAGEVVLRTKGSDKSGDHHFIWDGKDKNGEFAKDGFYNIKVKSEGTKIKNGVGVPFRVRSSATRSGKVASVEIENGVASAIILEGGKFIDKNQIKSIKEPKIIDPGIKLDSSFMDSNVAFDLSKMQIQSGAAEIYYNNHVKNPGSMEILVTDSSGKIARTISYNKKLEEGELRFVPEQIGQELNSIVLKDQLKGLEDGAYKVSITVENLDDNSKMVSLSSNFTENVIGLNYQNNKAIITGEKEISSYNIQGVSSKNYRSVQDVANLYMGKTITYRDDMVMFQKNIPISPDVVFSKIPSTKENSILLAGVMTLYNNKDEMVQMIHSPYNVYDQLTNDSKDYVINQRGDLFDLFNPNYENLDQDAKLEISKFIESELKKDPSNPNIIFSDEFKDHEQANFAKINFSWDGTFGDMKPNAAILKAETGEAYRLEFAPLYIRENGTTFYGDSSFNKSTGVVIEAKVENEDITLVFDNGQEIKENMILEW